MMLKNRILPAVITATVLATAGSAFAAGTTTLSKDEVAKIQKECKAEHKGNSTAIKSCVKEKQQAAQPEKM